MNYLQDLVNLIQVRNFLISSQEDMRIKLGLGQSSEIERKISQINKVLLDKSLALDIDKTYLSDTKQFISYSFESTEDLEQVLANLPAKPKKTIQPKKVKATVDASVSK